MLGVLSGVLLCSRADKGKSKDRASWFNWNQGLHVCQALSSERTLVSSLDHLDCIGEVFMPFK